MIYGTVGLFVFFYLAGILVDEEGAKLETFQGIFWTLIIVGMMLL